jgi:hypothetical protein
MSSGALDFNQLTGTGDIGQAIAAAQPALAPFVPQIVAGIHEAFSLGVASTFIIGIAGAVLAALAAAAMQELKLRQSNAPAATASSGVEGGRSALPAAD